MENPKIAAIQLKEIQKIVDPLIECCGVKLIIVGVLLYDIAAVGLK